MNTILFDLDGTLLPMNADEFVNSYFKRLAKKGSTMGIEPNILIKVIWQGIKAMTENQGQKTNEAVFWDTFASLLGEESRSSIPIFEEFYQNEFHEVKEVTTPRKEAAILINILKKKGYRLILATNPIFPRIATMARIEWAGLQATDFDWITTYENSSYTKPNLSYYEEILQQHSIDPSACMMIGNDVGEDMVAGKLGMKTFLLTDCLIKQEDAIVDVDYSGDFDQLLSFVTNLPDLQKA